MLKFELLTRQDWIKLAVALVAIGGCLAGLVFWLLGSAHLPPHPRSNELTGIEPPFAFSLLGVRLDRRQQFGSHPLQLDGNRNRL